MLELQARHRPWLVTAPAAMTAVVLTLLVARFDAIPVLAALTTTGALALLAMFPALAVWLAAVLIYANIPAAFRATMPAAEPLAGAFFALLLLACARRFLLDARVVFDRTLGLMMALAAIMLVSSFWAVDRNAALVRIGQFASEGLLLYWLMLQAVRSRSALRGVMWSVAATAALLASLSVYQVLTGDYAQNFGGLAQRQLRHEIAAAQADEPRATSPGRAAVRVADRAAGPVGDPNRHAQNLLLALPLALYLFRRQQGATKVLTFVLTAAIAAGVLLTYSRGAFVAIGVLILAAGMWRVVHRARLVAGIVAAALVVAVAAPTYLQRIGTIVNSLALVADEPEADPDGAILGRATEMLAALAAFRDHPILGVGPGQYTPYYSQSYQQRSDVKFRAISVPREPHDLFIAIAAETGLVGLIVFLGMVAWLIGDLVLARRVLAARDPDLSRLITAFLFSVVVYLACGLFLHLAYERYFWFLLGSAGAALRLARAEANRLATVG